jgi:NAD-dependent deacetylase
MIHPHHLIRSRQAAETCDVMIVIGTSATVQPAAFMPVLAKESGARIIEINRERTPLTASTSDYLIVGKAGEIVSRILDRLEKRSSPEKT